MALTGTFVRNLDQKHRLAIPKRLREDFGESRLTHLFVAPGTDRSLSVYASTAFETLAAQLTAHTGPVADSRNYLRMFYARAERVEIDGQVGCQLAHRRELVPWREKAPDDAVLHPLDDLAVEGHAALWIDGKIHGTIRR